MTTPIRRICPACWPKAANGASPAAAPPIIVMNSRRLIANPAPGCSQPKRKQIFSTSPSGRMSEMGSKSGSVGPCLLHPRKRTSLKTAAMSHVPHDRCAAHDEQNHGGHHVNLTALPVRRLWAVLFHICSFDIRPTEPASPSTSIRGRASALQRFVPVS
jgi:hypothetical protein